jgi:hypothetical protein
MMTVPRRTIVPEFPHRERMLAPGVTLRSLYPGGMAGPNGETSYDIPGGQTWSESLLLGTDTDDFSMCIPDIRLPPNQLTPMHWHDCWTVVVILEGKCLIGDWYMSPGDVFVAAPSIEYGPLLIGPMGCRLLEVFGDLALSPGGYGLEYRDHPTTQGSKFFYKPREGVNLRNEGHSSLPLAGTEGMWKTKLSPGWSWDLGGSDDPNRGVIRDLRLEPGEAVPPRTVGDWYCLLVVDGAIEVDGERLDRDDALTVAPGSALGKIVGRAEGAHVLEFARTARGL